MKVMFTPLMGFNAARSQIVDEVVKRVASSAADPLHLLNDAAYLEMKRLEKRGGDAYAEWRALAGGLGKMAVEAQRDKIAELAERYAWDVAGNFDPRVYKAVSKAGVPLLGAILKPRHLLKNLARIGDLSVLDQQMKIEGPVDTIRELSTLGTIVFTPTHLSNLDSVVFGFALERARLPPATYGAGKNLFTNPVLSFFMHNLGAYRVDRRLKHVLYKDVLKAYSSVLIERGYHSLFFPGGTRSRSGGVERKLKLGLAGTGLEAFVRTTERGRPQRVFFVPATINYLLTLEAETLIDDFLQEEGKARYIIDDDESTRLGRIATFVSKLVRAESSVVVRFSDPLDCFGNKVDARGQSHDARNRPVDAKTYILSSDDVPVRDGARDAQYTRELGDAICEAYKRDTVVMATHVVAAAAFDRLRRVASTGKAGGKPDIFALLRHSDNVRVSREELAADVDALLTKLRDLAKKGEIVVGSGISSATGDEAIAQAIRAFSGYHAHEILVESGKDILLTDTRLLFYYQNRLAAHGLGVDLIAPKPRTPAS